MVRYDMTRGFASNAAKLAVALCCAGALAVLFLASLDTSARLVEALGGAAMRGFSAVDVLSFFFVGSDYYRPDSQVPFMLPMAWLIQQVLVAALVGSYTTRDLAGMAPQVLVRMGGRWAWWFSKCTWTAAAVLAFYAMEAVVAWATSALFGGTEGAMGGEVAVGMMGFAPSSLGIGAMAALLGLPVVLSLALSLAQVALSLAVGPIGAFGAVVTFTVVSVYFGAPPFIGDFSMLARSAFVQPGGVDAAAVYCTCTAVAAVSVVCGGCVLQRKDLLGGREGRS